MNDGSLIFDVKVDSSGTSADLEKVRKEFFSLSQEIKDQRGIIRGMEKEMASLTKEAEKEAKSIYGVSDATKQAMSRLADDIAIAEGELVDMQTKSAKLRDEMKNLGKSVVDTSQTVSSSTKSFGQLGRMLANAPKWALSNLTVLFSQFGRTLANVSKRALNVVSPLKLFAALGKRIGSLLGGLANNFLALVKRLSVFAGFSVVLNQIAGSFSTLSGRMKSVNSSARELGQAWQNFSAVVHQIISPAIQVLSRGLALIVGQLTRFLAKKFDVNIRSAANALKDQGKSMGTLTKNTKKANQALLAFDALNKIESPDESSGIVSDDDVRNAQAVGREMQKIDDTANKVAENTNKSTQSLSQGGQAVQTLLTNIGDIWSDATPKLTEAAGKFGAEIKNIWSDAWENMQPSIETLRTNISDIWSSAGEQLAPIWSTFSDNFSEAIKNGDFLGAATALKDAIVQSWPIVWDALVATIKAGWDFVKEIAPIIWDALVETIKAGWDFVKEIAPIIWNALVDTIKAGWGFVKEIAPIIWNAIKEVAKSGWGFVKAVGPVVWDAIKEAGNTLIDWLKKIAPDIWQGLISAGTDLTNWLIGWIPDIWTWLADSAKTLYDAIVDWIPQIWDALINASKKIMDFLSSPELGEKFWEALKATAKLFWAIIKSAGPLLWKSMVATVKIIWNLIKGFGKLIWNILVSAIKDGWHNLMKWIKSHLSLKRLFGLGGSDEDSANRASLASRLARIPLTAKTPALAQGAVIPPNNPYLAVVGDQKSGTNIETPLSTMVDAFKQALSEIGFGNAVMQVDGTTFARLVYKYNASESGRIGVNLLNKE